MTTKSTYELERTAQYFLSIGLQSWGQSDEERLQARDAFLEAAGHPGDIAWLDSVLDAMPWGKFERERDYLMGLLVRNGAQ